MLDVRSRLAAWAYQWGPGQWYRPAWRFIVADIDVREGAWLDIGCGPGLLGIYAAEGNPGLDVVAIDTSEAMLQQAAAFKGGLLNLTLKKMDGAKIVYPDATFDVVTAVQTAHHWQDRGAILREVYRVLQPGGRFFLYEADPEGEIPEGWIARKMGWPPDMVLRRRWKRFGMDQGQWDGLKKEVVGVFGEVTEEHHGFYRRFCCMR